MAYVRECRECGADLASLNLRKDATFCCAEHRKAWNNRRALRGAELLDLFMAMRYQRAEFADKGMFASMCNLARAYRDADKALRGGRKSWDACETLARMPLAYGAEGDKR